MSALGDINSIVSLFLLLSYVSKVYSMHNGNGNGNGNGHQGPPQPPPVPTIFERRSLIRELADPDPCKPRNIPANAMALAIANQTCRAAYEHFMALTIPEQESCPEADEPECRSVPNHRSWRCTFVCTLRRRSGSTSPSPRPSRRGGWAALFICGGGSSSRSRREDRRVVRSTSGGGRIQRVEVSLEDVIKTVFPPPPPEGGLGPPTNRRRVSAGPPPGYQQL